VDTVLGLSVTPAAVRLVLVEGRGADGVTLEQDTLQLHSAGTPALGASDHVAAALLRAQAIAATDGQRLHAIGVTWSDDADADASALLESLRDLGFHNVVAVRWPEATEALAHTIWPVVGYDKTAVCVIEPETVMVSLVDPRNGAVQTEFSYLQDNGGALIAWLTALFDRYGFQPEGLFVLGSSPEIDAVAALLQHALSIPAFAPAEADLALARGAALVSTQIPDFAIAPAATDEPDGARRWPLAYIGALSMLGTGVLALVVSVSVAVGLNTTPGKDSTTTEHRQLANVAASPPAIPEAVAPVPQAVGPAVPPPEAPPDPPPEAAPAPPPDAAPPTADAPAADAPAEQLAPPASAPEVSAPEAPSVPPPAVAPVASPPGAPGAAPLPQQPAIDMVPPPAQYPQQQDEPPLRDRILSHIPFIGRHWQQQDQTPQTNTPQPAAPDAPPPGSP
jgi:hypothetical protein